MDMEEARLVIKFLELSTEIGEVVRKLESYSDDYAIEASPTFMTSIGTVAGELDILRVHRERQQEFENENTQGE